MDCAWWRVFSLCTLAWMSNNALHLRIYALMQFELKTLKPWQRALWVENSSSNNKKKFFTLVTYDLRLTSSYAIYISLEICMHVSVFCMLNYRMRRSESDVRATRVDSRMKKKSSSVEREKCGMS